jgi:hypothetical protein
VVFPFLISSGSFSMDNDGELRDEVFILRASIISLLRSPFPRSVWTVGTEAKAPCLFVRRESAKLRAFYSIEQVLVGGMARPSAAKTLVRAMLSPPNDKDRLAGNPVLRITIRRGR